MKTIQTEFPAEYAAFVETALRWFERYGVPVYCRNWFQTSRSVKANKVAATKLPSSSAAWKLLDEPTKALWRSAAKKATGYYRGYQLFVADFIYRRQNGLSLPGTPSDFHQLFGLELTNPSAALDVTVRRDDKDLVGPISYEFEYKKDENTPSGSFTFRVQVTAYYFTPGSYDTDVDTFDAPAGNVGWNKISRTFGTSLRKYFHVITTISIKFYDAVVQIDNYKMSDAANVIINENWNTKKYVLWEPTPLYRKQGWEFSPAYASPYIVHKYLG